MAQAAYDGWMNDMLAGKVTLMAAADNTAITELSARARADRILAGQVEADGVRLRDGNRAGAGDWIVTRQNERRLSLFGGRDWVKNSDAWRVEQRHADGSLTVRGMGHGGRTRLPAAYIREHVQLLYATTAHRAEGSTIDTAHPLITAGMTREALYVLATRAREKTTLYVATHDQPFDDDARVNQVRSDPKQYAAREVLLNIIAAESAKLPATETITVAQQESGSLGTLIPRYLHAARQHAESRYQHAAIQAFGEETGHALITDPAWDSVTLRLFNAEIDGSDPAQLLDLATAMREMISANSPAEVLAWRIDAIRRTTERNPVATASRYGMAATLPPWVPAPPPTDRADNSPITRYLNDAAELISLRVRMLTETAIRDRPPWMTHLGEPPATLYQRQQWQHHIAVIAAYRDQHKITTTDPRQAAGPYIEAGHPDHAAYQHAVHCADAAEHLASTALDGTSPNQARQGQGNGPARHARAGTRRTASHAMPTSARQPLPDPHQPQPRPGGPGIRPPL